MPAFPRHSIAWKLEQKSTLRALSLSLPWYGMLIGVLGRVYRWGALKTFVLDTPGPLLAAVTLGVVIVCGLATGHLANFTIRSWRWRAPAIGVFIALGEAVASLGLTLIGQERLGRATATLGEWPGAAVQLLWTRVVLISLFALALAGVVSALRASEGSSAPPEPTAPDTEEIED
jgi:hypothetical protein